MRPGSDVEHIVALIRARGYHMPDGMMYVRLVHLLDEQKRKELMIIYGEDAAQSGLTSAELQPGGKAHDRWPTIAKGLLERAEKRVGIKQTRPISPGTFNHRVIGRFCSQSSSHQPHARIVGSTGQSRALTSLVGIAMFYFLYERRIGRMVPVPTKMANQTG